MAGTREPAASTQFRLAKRLVQDLGPFFAERIDAPGAEARLRSSYADRGERFLKLIEREMPESAYARLLHHAGIAPADVRAIVHREGVEGALAQLADGGVYLSLDEFKGRTPIRRGSREVAVTSRAFGNPLGVGHIQVQTGGSRSTGTRVYVDLSPVRQRCRL